MVVDSKLEQEIVKMALDALVLTWNQILVPVIYVQVCSKNYDNSINENDCMK